MTRCRSVIPGLATSSAVRWATHSDPAAARLERSSLARTTDLLGEAHRLLAPRELAEVLLGLRALVTPLHGGEPVPAPSRRIAGEGAVTPAAGVYLRSVHVVLAERARTAHPDARRRLAGAIEPLLDDLAALPRGCEVPVAVAA